MDRKSPDLTAVERTHKPVCRNRISSKWKHRTPIRLTRWRNATTSDSPATKFGHYDKEAKTSWRKVDVKLSDLAKDSSCLPRRPWQRRLEYSCQLNSLDCGPRKPLELVVCVTNLASPFWGETSVDHSKQHSCHKQKRSNMFGYLRTQLEVDHDDGNLAACNHENHEHEKEKSKQIIELVLPDCLKQIAVWQFSPTLTFSGSEADWTTMRFSMVVVGKGICCKTMYLINQSDYTSIKTDIVVQTKRVEPHTPLVVGCMKWDKTHREDEK